MAPQYATAHKDKMSETIQVLALDIDGVVTDGTAPLARGACDGKRLAFQDLDAVTLARKAGLTIAFITGEGDAAVDLVADRFGVEFVLRDAKDKVAAMETLRAKLGVEYSQICYVGDGDRDAPALAKAGLALAPANATPAARAAAHRVLQNSGGSGAVAEAVRLLLACREGGQDAVEDEAAIRGIAEASISAHQRFLSESPALLAQIAGAITRALATGRKIVLFGNGGSAADAQHVAGELVGRFLRESQPWPAIALTTDSSILTCIGNDWDFNDVFARQVRAHVRAGDIAVGISTSGKSPNILKGLEDARKLGAVTIGFTGINGGSLSVHADLCYCAPSTETPRIQELHLLAWHAICEVVENRLMALAED